MSKCLILLSNYYPFHKGEEYLETEICYLSKEYEHVYIISTMVSNEMKQTRNVPENVTVIPVEIKFSLFNKLKIVFRQFWNIQKDPEKKKLIKEDSKGKIINKIYDYYFESRAMEVYNRVEKKLEHYNFDEYETISIYSYWLYITARVAVELKNKYFKEINPYTISRAHGYDINEHVNLLNFLPEREFLLDSLNNIFPVSQNGVDFLRGKYTKYAHKVDVRRLGTAKHVINIENDNNILHIVSCSVVRKLKRIDLIIGALAILRKKNIQFKWTHIGDGPELEDIKKLAKDKLDGSHFEFTGFIKNSDVLKWYQNNPTTVFINTSASEGVPVSIMEAMSVAIPVIATDVGGTKEIIEHNKNGYLLNSNCTEMEIAEKLLDILSMDKSEYEKMSRAAYDYWDKNCNSEKLYNTFTNELITRSKIN